MSILILSRFVVSAISPLSVNNGDRELLSTEEVAKDWNDIPYIPATSLTGVWRNILKKVHEDGEQFLGSENISKDSKSEDDNTNKDSKASSFYISNGILLDENTEILSWKKDNWIDNKNSNKNIFMLLTPNEIQEDQIYKKFAVLNPYKRSRVRINQRGTALDKSLFNTSYLPIGTRFMFDVHIRLDETSDQSIEEQKNVIYKALKVFECQSFCIGKNKSNGFGRVKIIYSKIKEIDLKDRKNAVKQINDFRSYKKDSIPTSLDEKLKSVSETKEIYSLLASFKLKGDGVWKIGNGEKALYKGDKESDSFIYQEKCLDWETNNKIKQMEKMQPIVCGSMIKGILSHRVAYYYRALTQEFADKLEHKVIQEKLNSNRVNEDLLKDLLGFTDENNQDDSQSGIILVNDSIITKYRNVIQRNHNKIDEFTQGVIQGALFNEELLLDPEFEVSFYIDKERFNKITDNNIKKALKFALADIRDGFLTIASGTSRNNSILNCCNKESAINEELLKE